MPTKAPRHSSVLRPARSLTDRAARRASDDSSVAYLRLGEADRLRRVESGLENFDGESAPPAGRLDGRALAEIANGLVGLHRRYYGRGATKAQAYQVNDDLILVELTDPYLTVERTLLDRGQADAVRQTRLTFQQTMFAEFVLVIQTICGRRVTSYLTESIASPERILEIFYLEPVADIAGRLEREAKEDRGEAQRPVGGLSPVE